MKAVMLSIQPRHCENIGTIVGEKNGKPVYKKTIEVRKKAPKCDTPFKCYIYCTNTRPFLVWGDVFRGNWETEFTHLVGYGRKEAEKIWDVFNGRVMGEFVCDSVEQFTVGSLRCDDIEKLACLSHKEMLDYFYKPNELDGKTVKFGYAWHISNLEIYDTPKELGEFRNLQGQPIKRAFQSWGYVCSNE